MPRIAHKPSDFGKVRTGRTRGIRGLEKIWKERNCPLAVFSRLGARSEVKHQNNMGLYSRPGMPGQMRLERRE